MKIISYLLRAGAFMLARFDRARGLASAANTEPDNYDANVMTHDKSVRRLNDSAITTRHLLWKKGAADNSVDICGVGDIALGTIDNTEPNTGMGQSLLLLGKGPTKKMIIASAINPGVPVYSAAAGQVQPLPVGAGAYSQVGTSLTGGNTAGDVIEVNDHASVSVTVSA